MAASPASGDFLSEGQRPLTAGLETVASAILADVEPGFQPGGKSFASRKPPVKSWHLVQPVNFSGRQAAALYGRRGSLPLLSKQTLTGGLQSRWTWRHSGASSEMAGIRARIGFVSGMLQVRDRFVMSS